METQRDIMERESIRLCEEQINRMEQIKEEELKMFDRKTKDLKQQGRERKDLEDAAKSLLDITRYPGFIAQATTFLAYNKLKKMTLIEDSKLKLLYRHPTCHNDPKKVRMHLEDHVIGYFSSDEEERQRQENSRQAQLGFFQRHGSVRSVGGDSTGTQMSAASKMSCAPPGMFPNISQGDSSVELMSSTHIKIFEASHLKIFSSILFSGNNMWICGWNKNWYSTKSIVLLEVDLPEYNMLTKQKKTDPIADHQTVMVRFGDHIIFTMKGGNEVFSCNSKTGTFRLIYNRKNLKVAALCSGDYHLFLLNEVAPGYIQILNSSYEGEGRIATGLWDVHDCSMDICLLKSSSNLDQNSPSNHTIIIATSFPKGFVRAVNQQNILWEVNSRSRPLDASFSPCSISACQKGVIFAVDHGKDKVDLF